MKPDDFVAYSCDKAGFLVWKPGLLTVPFWVFQSALRILFELTRHRQGGFSTSIWSARNSKNATSP